MQIHLAIDHLIYATRSIEEAAHFWWERFGLASYEGGVHPQYGTANRLVPLDGGAYLEIMGIVDEPTAMQNPLGVFVLDSTAAGDAWLGWCLRTDDIDGVAARIGSDAVPGERHLPGGGMVRWRLAGLEIALVERPLPFFIHWDAGSPHPSSAPLEHRCGATAIAGVDLTGDVARLAEHLGPNDLPISLTAGEPAISVRLTSDAGDLAL